MHTRTETRANSSALARFAAGAALSWAAFLAVSILFTAAARAQDEGDAPADASAPRAAAPSGGGAAPGKPAAGKEGKRTTINFEDQLVEGQAQKPELFYLLQQRNANFKRLVRLREDFLPEMRKTAEEIQRKGSGK